MSKLYSRVLRVPVVLCAYNVCVRASFVIVAQEGRERIRVSGKQSSEFANVSHRVRVWPILHRRSGRMEPIPKFVVFTLNG